MASSFVVLNLPGKIQIENNRKLFFTKENGRTYFFFCQGRSQDDENRDTCTCLGLLFIVFTVCLFVCLFVGLVGFRLEGESKTLLNTQEEDLT